MARTRSRSLPDGPWQHLVDVVNEWPGTAIVSMEFLAPRKEPKIEVIKEAFAGTDLQVVLTARDLARSLPAMWTESTQNRGVRTWEEFLDAVRNEDMSQKPGDGSGSTSASPTSRRAGPTPSGATTSP